MTEWPGSHMKTALVFDTETTGLPTGCNGGFPDPRNFSKYDGARILQIAWKLVNITNGETLYEREAIIRPTGPFTIHPKALETHNICLERIDLSGEPLNELINDFSRCVLESDVLVCHNFMFDYSVLLSEVYRDTSLSYHMETLRSKPYFCTMASGTELCQLPFKNGFGKRFKWPKLTELYAHLFNGETFEGAHDAMSDVKATTRCFISMTNK
jgi:DNA polymerase-3 subunit epsilon